MTQARPRAPLSLGQSILAIIGGGVVFVLYQDARTNGNTAMLEGLGTFAVIMAGIVAGSIVWSVVASIIRLMDAPASSGEGAGDSVDSGPTPYSRLQELARETRAQVAETGGGADVAWEQFREAHGASIKALSIGQRSELEAIFTKPAEAPKADDKPAAKPAGDQKPADKPTADAKPADKPKAEDKPADKPADKPKSDDKPAETPRAEDKPKATAKPKGDNNSSGDTECPDCKGYGVVDDVECATCGGTGWA